MFLKIIIVCFILIDFCLTKECGTIEVVECPKSEYIYIKGSVSPGSGFSNDNIFFDIISGEANVATNVEPFFGFNCFPTSTEFTKINPMDYNPDNFKCNSKSPLNPSWPFRNDSSTPYSSSGIWFIALKMCNKNINKCNFKLSARLLQGSCGQTAKDWQIATEEEIATANVCGGTRPPTPATQAPTPMPPAPTLPPTPRPLGVNIDGTTPCGIGLENCQCTDDERCDTPFKCVIAQPSLITKQIKKRNILQTTTSIARITTNSQTSLQMSTSLSSQSTTSMMMSSTSNKITTLSTPAPPILNTPKPTPMIFKICKCIDGDVGCACLEVDFEGETKQVCAPGAICQNNLCISENNILNGTIAENNPNDSSSTNNLGIIILAASLGGMFLIIGLFVAGCLIKKKFGHSGGYDFDEYQQQQAMPAQQIDYQPYQDPLSQPQIFYQNQPIQTFVPETPVVNMPPPPSNRPLPELTLPTNPLPMINQTRPLPPFAPPIEIQSQLQPFQNQQQPPQQDYHQRALPIAAPLMRSAEQALPPLPSTPSSSNVNDVAPVHQSVRVDMSPRAAVQHSPRPLPQSFQPEPVQPPQQPVFHEQSQTQFVDHQQRAQQQQQYHQQQPQQQQFQNQNQNQQQQPPPQQQQSSAPFSQPIATPLPLPPQPITTPPVNSLISAPSWN